MVVRMSDKPAMQWRKRQRSFRTKFFCKLHIY